MPLSEPAVHVLSEMAQIRHDGFVFPSHKAGRPLSNMAMLVLLQRMERTDITTHGFRSTFRDWASEETDASREVAEMALAHTVENKVEGAYRRGDLFEKRRRLMNEWASYCAIPRGPAEVVAFPKLAHLGRESPAV